MIALAFNFSNAQDAAIPEFKNKVYVVNGSNSLEDLDNTDLQTELNTTMGGSSSVIIKAKGKNAAVKNTGDVSEKFVVSIEAGIDPSNSVELFQYDVDKKNRKIVVVAMAMGKSKDITLPKQQLSFTKIKDGVWSISVKEKLKAGEYVFIIDRPNIDFMSTTTAKPFKGYSFTVAE